MVRLRRARAEIFLSDLRIKDIGVRNSFSEDILIEVAVTRLPRPLQFG